MRKMVELEEIHQSQPLELEQTLRLPLMIQELTILL
jgi:hypothetical protein